MPRAIITKIYAKVFVGINFYNLLVKHEQWWMVKGLKLSEDEKCFCSDKIKCN